MVEKIRSIKQIIHPQPVLEGAGVKLRRSIATRQLDYVDPFLLFDHFGSENPDDYLAGFPMHPHRGIETVTYMLAGIVAHKDSIGNAGEIGAGDVQWMTAGRGILHEEMPRPKNGKMEGFQLWVNLPARLKMTEPRYQEVVSSAIPELILPNGIKIRLIAGEMNNIKGAVRQIAANPSYMDITMPINCLFEHELPTEHNVIAYVLEGEASFDNDPKDTTYQSLNPPYLVTFDQGELITIHTKDKPIRFLLIAGKPLNEPVARYGPFVMNTSQEIQQTLQEIRTGTFIR